MTDQPTKGSVLLIDDDKFLLDMYALKFSKEGYNVHACLSVSEALDVLRGGFRADAVVFDLIMPGSDGFTFLEGLRSEKLAEGAAKVALTNESDDAERMRAMSLGATRYIVKATMIPSEVVNTVGEEIATARKR